MESGGVMVTALMMEHICRVGLSRKAMSGFKWLFLVVSVVFSAGRPVTAGTLTGKV